MDVRFLPDLWTEAELVGGKMDDRDCKNCKNYRVGTRPSGNGLDEMEIRGCVKWACKFEPSEEYDALQTVGILIRAKMEAMCNKGEYDDAYRLEDAYNTINEYFDDRLRRKTDSEGQQDEEGRSSGTEA